MAHATLRTRPLLGLGLGLLMTVLAGCGQSLPDHSADELSGRGDVAGGIRFSWWGSASRNDRTNAVADLFEAEHPGVEVKREAADFGNYFKRLNVQGAGRNMPCVTQLQARTLGDFTARDALLPLDPMIESGAIDVSHIPEAVLDTGRGEDGKLYMLPTGAAYDALMVNETLAEEAGVTLPEPGYDWDDYVTFLRDAAEGLPDGVPATALRGGLPNYFIAYVQGLGEQMFDGNQLGFSRELLVEYWEMWEEIRAEGLTNSPAANAEEPPSPEASYVASGDVLSDNRPGNALTPIQGTLDGQGEGQRMTSLPLPSGPAGQGNVLITSGLSIPRNCANLPTAAAFLDFWANDPRSGDTYASDNGAVTNTELLQRQLDDPELPDLKKRELALYQRIVADDPSIVLYPPGYLAVFESAFTRAYEDVAFGNQTVPEAVDTFFAEANDGLAR
ncbi:extracellular solute-binding protein [Streptomyces sp. 3MP-14]|uniref:Extracellular solute-binding protein n=1 Tax=Streptomyces mimosae TaxID=2586635 RepID=A0A5N6A8V6_9ACTN|nr:MULTISPECIES: ABC transporter substrate-binding protein [Streptomyces]KAB8165247.1 extracellular solute-binding protein [Streptomyces mimosae]KAB8175879.1 extracellular solute-binding protein [Streptomyces sp. 3MP-14]